MKCTHLVYKGQPMIVCGRNRIDVCRCGAPADLLCDWKTGKDTTCDRPVCKACALEVGPNKHLCQQHRAMWARHPLNPANGPPAKIEAGAPSASLFLDNQ
jgi:hypothetical protein